MRYQRQTVNADRLGARGRHVSLGLWLLLIVASFFNFGCGQQFELPPIPPPIPPADPGYNLKAIWHVPSPTDMVIHGPYAYVIEENARVSTYYSQHTTPDRVDIINEFSGLIQPVRIALGQSRDTTFIVVADSSDMRCKIYHWLGGHPLYSFTDSLWNTISGLTADEDLNVYVSDSQRNLIDSYDRWGEYSHNISKYGTGSGYVIFPHGIDAMISPGNRVVLLVADTGKHWAQRLFASESYTPAVVIPIGLTEDELLSPMDVAAGSEGDYIFISDSGHDAVLKYTFNGAFRDTVYSPTKMAELVNPPILRNRFIATRGPLVMISDEFEDRIVIVKYVSD